eukprot:GHVT01089401.1.p1 GENE.GHVT01089401.1~~GHVT01089401.1.p1  ORF type:complete len:195 (+),score=9.26 GHVT01089401.1:156-740(+)
MCEMRLFSFLAVADLIKEIEAAFDDPNKGPQEITVAAHKVLTDLHISPNQAPKDFWEAKGWLKTYFASQSGDRGDKVENLIKQYRQERDQFVASGKYFAKEQKRLFFRWYLTSASDIPLKKQDHLLKLDEMLHIMTDQDRTDDLGKMDILSRQLPAKEISKKLTEFQLHSLKYGLDERANTEVYEELAKSSYGK